MLKNALTVSVTWIKKHPLRYLLSWVSFGVIFLFMVVLISFGKSATAGSDENNLSAKIIVIGTHNRSIHSSAFLPANYKHVKKACEGLSYINDRAFLEIACSSVLLNETSFDNELIRVWRYHAPKGLLLEAEKRTSKLAVTNNKNAVFVNSSFLEKHGLSQKDLVGKEIRLSGIVDVNRKDQIKKANYIVDAVIDTTDTFLGEADIFIPFEEENIDDLMVDRVDIELTTVNDFISAQKILYEKGYILSVLNDPAEYGDEFTHVFSRFGIWFGIVLFLIASVGMANTIAETLESNKDYFKMMYLIGCKPIFMYYVIVLTTVIQGIIGALIGLLLSYLLMPAYPKLIEYIMGLYYEYVKYSATIGAETVFKVFAFCVIFSFVCGIMVCIVLKSRSVISFEMKNLIVKEKSKNKNGLVKQLVLKK